MLKELWECLLSRRHYFLSYFDTLALNEVFLAPQMNFFLVQWLRALDTIVTEILEPSKFIQLGCKLVMSSGCCLIGKDFISIVNKTCTGARNQRLLWSLHIAEAPSPLRQATLKLIFEAASSLCLTSSVEWNYEIRVFHTWDTRNLDECHFAGGTWQFKLDLKPRDISVLWFGVSCHFRSSDHNLSARECHTKVNVFVVPESPLFLLVLSGPCCVFFSEWQLISFPSESPRRKQVAHNTRSKHLATSKACCSIYWAFQVKLTFCLLCIWK